MEPDGSLETPHQLYAEGCVPDVVLVLRDGKGNTLARLKAVKAILAAWSPVLRGAFELSPAEAGAALAAAAGPFHGSSSCGNLGDLGDRAGAAASSGGGGGPAAGANAGNASAGAAGACQSSSSGGGGSGTAAAGCAGSGAGFACGSELPLLVDSHKEVEAWRIAMCLMHPLDPTSGKTPSSLITTCAVKPLVMLADKYNLQGLLPHCKDMLLDPRSSFGVPGIQDSYKLDALEWIQIAEGVPGFEAVVARCIKQIVISTTISRGRSQRTAGSADQPRYRGHEALVSAVAGLRPETCAKLAASMASCLAVAAENMANQDRYSIQPVGEGWGWEYCYEPLRK